MITVDSIDTPPGSPRARRVRFKELMETILVPASVIKVLQIEVGDTFPDTSDLELLVEERAQEAARSRLMKLVAMRDYSTFELKKKLTEDGYAQKIIKNTIDFANDIGAADDERYLHAFVRSRLAVGEGQQKIVRSLRNKGFEKNEIDCVYKTYIDDETKSVQLEKAMRLLDRLDISDYKGRDKAFKKIVARGYSFDTAKLAISRVTEKRQEVIYTAENHVSADGSQGEINE